MSLLIPQIQVDKICPAWSGSLCIGLTTFNPEELAESQCLPSSATALEKKTWLMMGPEIRINGQTNRENFAPTLERLQVSFCRFCEIKHKLWQPQSLC